MTDRQDKFREKIWENLNSYETAESGNWSKVHGNARKMT